MKARDTFLGFLVLSLVLAGMYWARLRPSPSAGAPAGQAASGSASDGVSAAHPPSPPATPASEDDTALPDVTVADRVVELGDVHVTLSVSPRPPVAFAKQRFRVHVTSSGAPALLEGGRISFEMRMPMGDHRYTVVPGADGWQEAEVVVPMCPSGNPRWYATVEGAAGGRPVTARFRLDLTKPGSTP